VIPFYVFSMQIGEPAEAELAIFQRPIASRLPPDEIHGWRILALRRGIERTLQLVVTGTVEGRWRMSGPLVGLDGDCVAITTDGVCYRLGVRSLFDDSGLPNKVRASVRKRMRR
jgi:hypothetical protein